MAADCDDCNAFCLGGRGGKAGEVEDETVFDRAPPIRNDVVAEADKSVVVAVAVVDALSHESR